ncbi:MAG: cytosine permease [Fibrobacter sp.]|nr:cytosine permease [Fibrobacter sp.]
MRTSVFSNGVIWFGAAISVSEIVCGIEIGEAAKMENLWFPLVLGHILGGVMLYLVGLVGARSRLNAMESTVSTFGKFGSKFFAALNLLQLVGWIAVLNAQGAMALAGLNFPLSFSWTCLLLSVCIGLWVFAGIQKTKGITTVVMGLLAVLLVILTARFWGMESVAVEVSTSDVAPSKSLGFWSIFEISIAMPLSWLPVISDYTKDAQRPVAATAVSAVAYTFASLWMYFIGLQISFLGVGVDIAKAILLAGIGVPGIVIVVLSTVTTNFIAANSAGESAKAIFARLNPKITGVVASMLSALLAVWGIVDHYIGFLYLIAAVFAPMASVLLVSCFCLKERLGRKGLWVWNLVSWAIGFAVYEIAANTCLDYFSPTILSIAVSAALTFAVKLK